MEFPMTTDLHCFAMTVIETPKVLNKDEAWSLALVKSRGALASAATAAGFAFRYYPNVKGSDKLVLNRLKKASTARLIRWAQGKPTVHAH